MARQRARTAQRRRTEPDYGRRRTALRRYAVARIRAAPGAPPDSLALDALERHHILKVLEYAKGNKTEAARLLGIGIATLYRKLESYGV